MGSWRVFDDKLDHNQKFTPIGRLAPSDVVQQNIQNLLSFLMNALVSTQLARPHRSRKAMLHSHQRCELSQQRVLELSTPV